LGKPRPEPHHHPGKSVKKKKTVFPLFILALSSSFCVIQVSCGIEDYYYLYPVTKENGSITVASDYQASIILPDISASYFTHFTIYYRVYVTDQTVLDPSTDTSPSGLGRINQTLASDYSTFAQYIDSETNVNINMGSLFSNRNYYPLEVEGARINLDVLNQSSPRQTITLDFQGGKNPTLKISNNPVPFDLLRSTGDGKFSPQPATRYFVNDQDLYNPSYINQNFNADVANKSGMALSTRYTYAAFFIVVTGLDSNYSPIYSTPAFIGVLRLPEPF
jgi:hypothetical protein